MKARNRLKTVLLAGAFALFATPHSRSEYKEPEPIILAIPGILLYVGQSTKPIGCGHIGESCIRFVAL